MIVYELVLFDSIDFVETVPLSLDSFDSVDDFDECDEDVVTLSFDSADDFDDDLCLLDDLLSFSFDVEDLDLDLLFYHMKSKIMPSILV